MSDGKTSISQASSYEEIAEFWDAHDLGEFWDQTKPAEFEFDPSGSEFYFRVERHLAERLRQLARQRGVSAETLLNLWLQERLQREHLPPEGEPAPVGTPSA